MIEISSILSKMDEIIEKAPREIVHSLRDVMNSFVYSPTELMGLKFFEFYRVIAHSNIPLEKKNELIGIINSPIRK